MTGQDSATPARIPLTSLNRVCRSALRSVMQVVTAARRSFTADRLDHRQSSYYDGRRPQGTYFKLRDAMGREVNNRVYTKAATSLG